MVREQDLFRVSMRKWYKKVMHYPCPPNLNIWWNFGSMLLACVIIQIVTGLLLSVHYTADDNLAFRSIKHIMRDVNNGWAIRNIHAGGASVFFFCLYIHIARGIYYGTFLNSWATWNVGVLLYFLSMATAFSGYVLPWGTMSYWAATVIINMLGCLPFGKRVVLWALGGKMVNNNTLKRIYTLHFILPFVILFVSGVHIWFLHKVGSSNPLGIDLDGYLVRFHPYYTTKDLVGLVFLGAMYWFMAFVRPDLSYEPLNYVKIDKFKTPNHIQPEWYFLYAYAILKCIPYKTLGVTAMLMSSMCMVLLPLIPPKYRCQSMCMYPLTGFVFWWWVSNFCFLTAVGTCRPEGLAYEYGQRAIYYHFAFFLVVPFLNKMWDTLITNDYYFAPWGCWQFKKWMIYLEQELIDDAKKIAGKTSKCEVFDVNDMLDMELVELKADAKAFVASCGTYRMSIVEFWRNLKGWIFDILYRILQWVDEWSAGCKERRMAFFLFLSSLSMLDFMWGTAFGVWLVAWVKMGIFWSNVLTFSVLLSCVYAYKKTRESYLEAKKEMELDKLSNKIKEMEAKMEEVEKKFKEAKKKL